MTHLRTSHCQKLTRLIGYFLKTGVVHLRGQWLWISSARNKIVRIPLERIGLDAIFIMATEPQKNKDMSQGIWRLQPRKVIPHLHSGPLNYHQKIWHIFRTSEFGSFWRYRGTDYLQQKGQYNQAIKPLGELYCLVPLFFRDDGTYKKTPEIWRGTT